MKHLILYTLILLHSFICNCQEIIGVKNNTQFEIESDFLISTNANIGKIYDEDSIDITNDNVKDISFRITLSGGATGLDNCAHLKYTILNKDIIILYNESTTEKFFNYGDTLKKIIIKYTLNDYLAQTACKGSFNEVLTNLSNKYVVFKNSKNASYGSIKISFDIYLEQFLQRTLTCNIHKIILDTTTKIQTKPIHFPPSISPNPMSGQILSLQNFDNINGLRLIDMMGKVIPISLLNNHQIKIIASTGLYFLYIYHGDGKEFMSKLIVKD
jgi:hypothetical protein